MKMNMRMKVLGTLVGALALALAGAPAYAATGNTTCAGGLVTSGTYANLTIAGPCAVPEGAVVTVNGNLTVQPGAGLDAQSASSTIRVKGNVNAGARSLLGLGCQPPSAVGNSGHACTVDPEGISDISVNGSITATGATAVLLNGISVKGNVTLTGGGSDIPWTVKNSTIGGNIRISGQTTDWIGVLFNHVGGNAAFTDIVITDTDPGAPGMFIGHNTVRGNLGCSGITPGVSGGFPPGSVNTVRGNATGQCRALV